MCFCRRVNDTFNSVRLQEALDQGLICDVTMHKLISRMAFEITKVCPIAGVSEGVQIHDVMAALYNQSADQMRAYETGAAGDENIHVRSSLFAPVRLTNWLAR